MSNTQRRVTRSGNNTAGQRGVVRTNARRTGQQGQQAVQRNGNSRRISTGNVPRNRTPASNNRRAGDYRGSQGHNLSGDADDEDEEDEDEVDDEEEETDESENDSDEDDDDEEEEDEDEEESDGSEDDSDEDDDDEPVMRHYDLRGLSYEEIDRVSTSRVFVPTGTNQDPPECSICLEQFKASEVIRKLRCRHQFHSGCLVNWLRSQTTCPLCRRKLCLCRWE